MSFRPPVDLVHIKHEEQGWTLQIGQRLSYRPSPMVDQLVSPGFDCQKERSKSSSTLKKYDCHPCYLIHSLHDLLF